jgi:hypothetical protein
MCSDPFHCTYIFNCLANNLKFNLQPWPFNDAASRPLLGYRWLKIMHLTCTVEGRYMMYSNAFDCITFRQVRQHLFTCRIFSNINKCQKKNQICRLLGSHTRPTRSMVWLSMTFAGMTSTYGRPLSLLFATT